MDRVVRFCCQKSNQAGSIPQRTAWYFRASQQLRVPRAGATAWWTRLTDRSEIAERLDTRGSSARPLPYHAPDMAEDV